MKISPPSAVDADEARMPSPPRALSRLVAAALAPAGLSVDRGVSAFHGFPNPFRYGHPDVKRIHDVAYGESLPGAYFWFDLFMNDQNNAANLPQE